MNGLQKRLLRHRDHHVVVRPVIFRNGKRHWELRCEQCDRFIQYVPESQAREIQKLELTP
jgi:hypothetical protein